MSLSQKQLISWGIEKPDTSTIIAGNLRSKFCTIFYTIDQTTSSPTFRDLAVIPIEDHWYEVGALLGIKPGVLNRIQEEPLNSNNTKRKRAMFRQWLEQPLVTQPSWQRLLSALMKVGAKATAEILRAEYGLPEEYSNPQLSHSPPMGSEASPVIDESPVCPKSPPVSPTSLPMSSKSLPVSILSFSLLWELFEGVISCLSSILHVVF